MFLRKTQLCHFTFFILSIFIITFSSTIASSITCRDSSRCEILPDSNSQVKEIQQGIVSHKKSDASKVLSSRRFLTPIGSHAPTCVNSCETCTPCTPVLVPGPPPESEVWKCKCKDKLYDPIG
ncbi:EPIDERMAL PATTERNING FACTOR-like protein 6 [Lathyrus oleraceus]|uniref:EPIDERMAL PATTERNING FACTOR-like protein 6 n=1 Tax=Pisum sativum TaxID=3888 RepID=UPI0021CF8039|nr:EPIDERMAL PATTERNING FACTOR-like protein 6 isoform X2 [Pisum sativum]XP_050902412.1 EPIDERMAL PATTERNING FACTOR-like protein 6 [Pisum sativum]XP_050902413.1 EPIDERMAL PATTERNING FACTOR-like protein 6 [Pisum sativum]